MEATVEAIKVPTAISWHPPARSFILSVTMASLAGWPMRRRKIILVSFLICSRSVLPSITPEGRFEARLAACGLEARRARRARVSHCRTEAGL